MKVLFWWRVLAVIRVLQKLRWLVKAARAPPRPTPFRGTSPSLAEPGDRGSLGNSSTDIGSGVVVVPAVAFFPSAVPGRAWVHKCVQSVFWFQVHIVDIVVS